MFLARKKLFNFPDFDFPKMKNTGGKRGIGFAFVKNFDEMFLRSRAARSD